MKKAKVLLCLLLAAAMLLSGCGRNKNTDDVQQTQPDYSIPVVEETAAPSATP